MILLGLVLMVGSANASFRQGFAEAAAVATVSAGFVAVVGVILTLVGVGLIVLAVFAQRGRNGARITLTVVGGLFLFLQLLSILSGAPQGLVGFIWIAVAITLFWVGSANAWYQQHAQP